MEKHTLFGPDLFLATTLVRALEGKTVDLSSAHKQFPLHLSRLDPYSCAKTWGKQLRYLRAQRSAFWTVWQCFRFLEGGRCIVPHHITIGLGVWAGAFFDDFPVLCLEDVSQQNEKHVSLLLDLLGMRFAKEGAVRFQMPRDGVIKLLLS